jgi:L-alanine-DL-glutamate epimerase-like enolase superfamily enzyme
MFAWMQESNQSAIREIKMIPDDLMARVQRLADAEGITTAEFIVRCPDGPGLGVQYDWDFIDRNRMEHHVFTR